MAIRRYRNMCRYNSGVRGTLRHSTRALTPSQFFYRHALMQKYRYYWRVECVLLASL
jgi:hypothetical protein